MNPKKVMHIFSVKHLKWRWTYCLKLFNHYNWRNPPPPCWNVVILKNSTNSVVAQLYSFLSMNPWCYLCNIHDHLAVAMVIVLLLGISAYMFWICIYVPTEINTTIWLLHICIQMYMFEYTVKLHSYHDNKVVYSNKRTQL